MCGYLDILPVEDATHVVVIVAAYAATKPILMVNLMAFCFKIFLL